MDVIEIDGPQMAYFEVTVMEPDTGRELLGRLLYRTVACIGESEDQVREWMNASIARIREQCRMTDAFIIWRRRPVFALEEPSPAPPRWSARARLVTSRPIDNDAWSDIAVADGAEVRKL